MPGLNHKQKKFASEYLVDGNATQAAIRAGYSARTAHSAGPRLLDNVGVKALIDAKREKVFTKIDEKGEKVLTEIAHFAHSNIKAAFGEDGCFKPLVSIPDEVAKAIRSIEVEEIWHTNPLTFEKTQVGRVVKLSLWDKPKGLELLGKNQKLFTEKHEHSVSDSLADLLVAARKPETDK